MVILTQDSYLTPGNSNATRAPQGQLRAQSAPKRAQSAHNMPIPPVDMSAHQASAGVRTRHMHRISPMAKFVDPQALLLLQSELEKGNELALLLDDK